jgi:hypothetical protein
VYVPLIVLLEAPTASVAIGFPVIVKPTIGSGYDIRKGSVPVLVTEVKVYIPLFLFHLLFFTRAIRGVCVNGVSVGVSFVTVVPDICTISFRIFAVAKAVFTLPASISLSDRVRSLDCTIRSTYRVALGFQ